MPGRRVRQATWGRRVQQGQTAIPDYKAMSVRLAQKVTPGIPARKVRLVLKVRFSYSLVPRLTTAMAQMAGCQR